MDGSRFAKGYFEDAAARLDTIGIVTFASVVPIAEEDTAVGTIHQCQATEPGVVGQEKILAMMSDVAGAVPFQHVLIDAVTVQVTHENMMTILVGPIVAEVDHGAGMGVAAAGNIVYALAATRTGPVAAAPMDMIGAAGHQAVTMRIQIRAEHAYKMSARDDVEQVLDNAVGDERFAVIIEV